MPYGDCVEYAGQADRCTFSVRNGDYDLAFDPLKDYAVAITVRGPTKADDITFKPEELIQGLQ